MIDGARYRLKERRERLGLTRERLAWRAKLSAQTIRNAEKARVPGHTLQRIRRALVETELVERRWTRELRRIERQRELWSQIPDCKAARDLRRLMFDRARDLLDENEAERADELLEFLPADDVKAFLDGYFEEEVAAIEEGRGA